MASDLPPTTPTPTDTDALAGRLRFAVVRLARRMRQQDDGGLPPTLGTVLGTIERCGPLTLGDLASREQMAPPSITKAVAKLETLGLVRRSKDDHDRRVFRVEITAKGRRQLEASRTRRTAWLATRLREVSEEDLAVLDAAASVLDRLTSPPETAP